MYKKAIEKVNDIFSNLKYFINKKVGKTTEFEAYLLNWTNEIIVKNKVIHMSKGSSNDKENVGRTRGYVYWIDFGVNIGSEFNFPHFGVVLKEFDYTAIVVPISTEKEDDAEWKSPENLIIKIGKLNDLPYEKKDCYAMVSQIRSISKQRLSYYKDRNGKFYNKIKLTSGQLDKIDSMVLKLTNINRYDVPYQNDYY